MEYKIISEAAEKCCDTSNITTRVNEEIKNGYEPHGSLGMTFDPEHKWYIYYQALIKES